MKIAIIGAGLAGVVLAKQLSKNHDVTVFEKARGVGGRLSTRYADTYQFDHGAQFFLAKTEEFKSYAEQLESEGAIARWYPQFAEMERGKITQTRKWNDGVVHYVAVPKMNQLCKHIAKDLNVKIATRVTKIEKKAELWILTDENSEPLGEFNWVISAAPAEQTAELLPQEFSHMKRVQNTKMTGCFSLMLGYEKPLELPWQTALIKKADLSWVTVNSSKPQRETGYSLLALATNSWAEEHMEDDAEDVKNHMYNELADVTGQEVRHADYVALHRWRYANVDKQEGEEALVDYDNKLAACGDWCIQGRVESAFTSASYLAKKMEGI